MKKIISLLLTLSLSASLLLTCAAGTYNKKQIDQADALNHLGLFLGTGQGYELDARLDRSQSITLILRMLGEIAEAEKGGCKHPFTDVPEWADKYVAYAYEKGYVKGYSATTFGGTDQVSDFQYLTMVLRAMGYSDSGETPDFDYRKSAVLAKELGLVTSADDDPDFVRGNAVEIFWNAMSTKLKNSEETLSERLIAQKVFTQAQFDTASSYAKNGKPTGGGSSSGGTSSGGSTPAPTPDSSKKPQDYTWEEYQAMDAAGKTAFINSFDDPMKFIEWQQKAEADYKAAHPSTEIDNGESIDLGKLTGGK